MFIQTLDPQLVLQKWESAGGSRPSDKGRGGGGHPDSEINWGGAGGAWSPKKFFRPFGPQFGLKIRRGGPSPRAPPLDPPLVKKVDLHAPSFVGKIL